jgi:hypothetical protein
MAEGAAEVDAEGLALAALGVGEGAVEAEGAGGVPLDLSHAKSDRAARKTIQGRAGAFVTL